MSNESQVINKIKIKKRQRETNPIVYRTYKEFQGQTND